ncbi:hypothetical protein [Caballeronia sp. J97]|uniref:hypothetical protein n=1 Tax=Caballeronia sp. J97 TaxID=2805429 RepID=UPI002AAF4823|nr:hypothetical protein [Caballeronia sp. J97]
MEGAAPSAESVRNRWNRPPAPIKAMLTERDRNWNVCRAASVTRYLSRANGIAPDRLVAIGKGSQELAKADEPAAPENRRVTIVRPGE